MNIVIFGAGRVGSSIADLLCQLEHSVTIVDTSTSGTAGLVVDEVQGFRRFMDSEYTDQWSQTAVRCDRYVSGAYERGQDSWPIFGLYDLLESSSFLQAAAE